MRCKAGPGFSRWPHFIWGIELGLWGMETQSQVTVQRPGTVTLDIPGWDFHPTTSLTPIHWTPTQLHSLPLPDLTQTHSRS